MKNIQTLCIVYRYPRVLLGMKKRGFGAGRWNGFGGKVEDGEGIEAATKRELREESGVVARELEKAGILEFSFRGKLDFIEAHIFRVEQWSEEPKEGEEMKPEWFSVDEIPFHLMWPDDAYWMPLFLERKKFRGSFLFAENDAILEHTLNVVQSF